MANVQRVFANDVGEQDLLPGISDDITIQNIVPKVTWKTCNVLQMVNRRWQQTIHNRSVYNSKVFWKSTEGFVVLPYKNPKSELILTLYACKDGSSLQLPVSPITKVYSYDYICLDGKVYLWVIPDVLNVSCVEACVLDLAGDRRWAHLKQLHHSYRYYSYGVLDGKIYKFQGCFYPARGVLNGWTIGTDLNRPASTIENEVFSLPQTEVYDPVSDVWSFVTPEPPKKIYQAPKEDLERHLACFSRWARIQMAADFSMKSWFFDRYESYFSEWRRARQAIHDETPSVLDDCQNAMATQVYTQAYYKH